MSVSRAGVVVAIQKRCAWHRCKRQLAVMRVTRRFCSDGCRGQAQRARRYAQRLRACAFELIGKREARALIRRHELLGTCGNAKLWLGLRGPDDRILSLVGFGHGPNGGGADVDVVLERVFTVRQAPRNAASYLIARALRWGVRHLGWRRVKAFADPSFGERGLVYAASGFKPCPPSKHGPIRYVLIENGRTMSDRTIRRRYRTHAAARAAGAEIVRVPERQAWLWEAGCR
jgi:hypothetical protein